jgi:hypothetical protein
MLDDDIFFPRRPPLLLFILFVCFALAAWLGTVLCLSAFDFFLLAFVPVGPAQILKVETRARLEDRMGGRFCVDAYTYTFVCEDIGSQLTGRIQRFTESRRRHATPHPMMPEGSCTGTPAEARFSTADQRAACWMPAMLRNGWVVDSGGVLRQYVLTRLRRGLGSYHGGGVFEVMKWDWPQCGGNALCVRLIDIEQPLPSVSQSDPTHGDRDAFSLINLLFFGITFAYVGYRGAWGVLLYALGRTDDYLPRDLDRCLQHIYKRG